MRYRILRNECYKYQVEKQQFGQEWELITRRENGASEPREFSSYQYARDHIQDLIEAPEQERKRNAWTVIETVEDPNEQENT